MNVVCTYLLETLLSILFVCFVLFFILLALYPEVELLDQMLILFLIFFFDKTLYCFLQWLHRFTCPPTVQKSSNFSASSPTLVFSVFIFE